MYSGRQTNDLNHHFDPAPNFRINLTGAWLCDDGGAYFIRHYRNNFGGSSVDWLGLSEKGLGNHFTNVFFGGMVEVSPYPPTSEHWEFPGTIRGLWVDVPRGETMSSGELRLIADPNGRRIVLKQQTGNFGGRVWTRL